MAKRSYLKSLNRKADLTKPCRCGSGYYCHRHLVYALVNPDTTYLAPPLTKINHGKKLRPKTSSRAQSMGGQH